MYDGENVHKTKKKGYEKKRMRSSAITSKEANAVVVVQEGTCQGFMPRWPQLSRKPFRVHSLKIPTRDPEMLPCYWILCDVCACVRAHVV